ncbi:MAG: hypothetical protein HC837_05280 [Chloroflexaceae bacterium]|nr:hypothetical protein [Chloroflexaceae bacterium]
MTNELQTLDKVETVMHTFLGAAKAETVFAPPVQHGDSTLISCAEVVLGMGFGVGGGTESKKGTQEQGGGGGGGGHLRSRPVATIVVDSNGVRIEPIIDKTKVVLAALTTAAFMLFWLLRLSRVTRADDKGPSLDEARKAIEGA